MLPFDWLSCLGSHCHDFFVLLCEFIECQLDILYMRWLVSLFYPALLTVFILPFTILFMLYFSALVLHIYTNRWSRMREVLHESLTDPWVGGRYLISLIWDAHGYIWHGYDVVGMEHVPSNKGGLIVYYHGAIPLDAYYLVARFISRTGRHIHCVGDRFLQKIPGWQVILEAFRIAPSSVSDCVRTVTAGHMLAVSPGGLREAQFSDHSYTLLWGGRRGFAKVAIQANCPIIPMFTRNLREAFRVVSFPSVLWEALYRRFKLPFAPIYGGFPVKLVSHLGPCIYPLPGETAEQLAGRVEAAVCSLIAQHQRLPGNILGALLDRLHPSLGRAVMGPGVGAAGLGEAAALQVKREDNTESDSPVEGGSQETGGTVGASKSPNKEASQDTAFKVVEEGTDLETDGGSQDSYSKTSEESDRDTYQKLSKEGPRDTDFETETEIFQKTDYESVSKDLYEADSGATADSRQDVYSKISEDLCSIRTKHDSCDAGNDGNGELQKEAQYDEVGSKMEYEPVSVADYGVRSLVETIEDDTLMIQQKVETLPQRTTSQDSSAQPHNIDAAGTTSVKVPEQRIDDTTTEVDDKTTELTSQRHDHLLPDDASSQAYHYGVEEVPTTRPSVDVSAEAGTTKAANAHDDDGGPGGVEECKKSFCLEGSSVMEASRSVSSCSEDQLKSALYEAMIPLPSPAVSADAVVARAAPHATAAEPHTVVDCMQGVDATDHSPRGGGGVAQSRGEDSETGSEGSSSVNSFEMINTKNS